MWAAFEELEEKWGNPYPAIPKLWRAAWEEFTLSSRTTWNTPGPIQHQRDRILHTRYRRAITVRGHFPTEQAALKTLY